MDSNLVSLMHTNYLSDMAANEYNYSFLHYALPDSIGHSGGWESESWNSSVELIDGYLGDVFDLVEPKPMPESIIRSSFLLLTMVGRELGTGLPTTRANYTIPVLVWGSGVAPSADLYVLNPTSRLESWHRAT